MARMVGDAIGVQFIWNDFFEEYQAKVGRCVLTIEYDNYETEDEKNGKRFIGVGFENKKEHHGAGYPADSVEEAIEWFRRKV